MSLRVLVFAGLLASCLGFTQRPAMAGEDELKSITYAVGDLVIPIRDAGVSYSAKAEGKERPPTLEANLAVTILRTIAPESWDEVGGRCTIKYYPEGMALVIKQTQANHERIADLLAAMRRFHALEVALEVRMVTVPESLFARLESDFGIHCDWLQLPCKGSQATCPSEKNFAFISSIEEARLTHTFETDRRTQVCCAPKITVFNGQAANLSIAEKKRFLTKVSMQVAENGQVVEAPVQEPFDVGFKMNARPVISADRRFIRVAFDISNTELGPDVSLIPVQFLVPAIGKSSDDPVVFTMYLQKPQLSTQHIASTVSIPDGGTAIFCGPEKILTKRAKADTSLIAKVPCLDRFFGEPVGYYAERSRVLLMLTPRIIINDENEAKPAVASVKVPQVLTCGVQTAAYTAPRTLPGPIPAAPCRTTTLVSDLLKAYDDACAAGHADEAERLARAALAIDATCFQKRP